MLPNRIDMPDWEGALCREIDPELFFPDNIQTMQYRMAKKICGECSLADVCLEYALKDEDLLGVWGGTLPKERNRIRFERKWNRRKAC